MGILDSLKKLFAGGGEAPAEEQAAPAEETSEAPAEEQSAPAEGGDDQQQNV